VLQLFEEDSSQYNSKYSLREKKLDSGTLTLNTHTHTREHDEPHKHEQYY